MTRSGTSPAMKSSSEGPSVSVLLKFALDGVARVRAWATMGVGIYLELDALNRDDTIAVDLAIAGALARGRGGGGRGTESSGLDRQLK